MTFIERLELVREILKDCPYDVQKKKIKQIFDNYQNNQKEDILLKLIVIDSCYSTNMNKRLFGFQDLVELLYSIDNELNGQINVIEFIKKRLSYLIQNVGIDKKGNNKGHGFSLISKYIFFKTNYNFPIYDRLVWEGLFHEHLLPLEVKKDSRIPTISYFKAIEQIKNTYQVSYDEIDMYFWVIGKIKNGNLSLLLPSKGFYKNEFIEKLNLSDDEKNQKSEVFKVTLAERLISNNVIFTHEKLIKIQTLARLVNEPVFEDISKLH